MDDMIRYLGVLTLGSFSVPLALGLAWFSLRCVFGLMPTAQHIHARPSSAAGAGARRPA